MNIYFVIHMTGAQVSSIHYVLKGATLGILLGIIPLFVQKKRKKEKVKVKVKENFKVKVGGTKVGRRKEKETRLGPKQVHALAGPELHHRHSQPGLQALRASVDLAAGRFKAGDHRKGSSSSSGVTDARPDCVSRVQQQFSILLRLVFGSAQGLGSGYGIHGQQWRGAGACSRPCSNYSFASQGSVPPFRNSWKISLFSDFTIFDLSNKFNFMIGVNGQLTVRLHYKNF
jgi:hypothetical protein